MHPLSSPSVRVVPLAEATHPAFGGKAVGLARLCAAGRRVPAGVAITGDLDALCRADPDAEGSLWTPVLEAAGALGSPRLAVRSSAGDEDGRQASFAGQYDTVLDVAGSRDLVAAVRRCVGSFRSARAAAYRDARRVPGAGREAAETGPSRPEAEATPGGSVVIQAMVEAKAAGVAFTADPVTGRRDRVVVDAVAGLGDALVGGRADPDHFELTPAGAIVAVTPGAAGGEAISAEAAQAIAREAVELAARLGQPLDLEWALDAAGTLWWLQARPITTLGADPRELDSDTGPQDVLTRGNAGEMMPGAMCPLTISTTVRGIDYGTQAMLVATGALETLQPVPYTVAIHFGHIFFNLSRLRRMADRVAGSSVEMLAYAICGQAVPELGAAAPEGRLLRAVNGARYARWVLTWRAATRRLEARLRTFQVVAGESPRQSWESLDAALGVLDWTYAVHLQSSAGSGVAAGALAGILARGQVPGAETEAAVARALERASGVVSADLLLDLDGVAEAIAGVAEAPKSFADVPPAAALAWLREAAPPEARERFERFLTQHGHRAFRELDMRQPGWRDDPVPLVRALQASVRSASAGRPPGPTGAAAGTRRTAHRTDEGAPPDLPRWLRPWLAWARQTVRNREYTKNLLVAVTDRIKRGYRRLGVQMARRGLLPDPDAVFFLTHEELGAQCLDGAAERQALAEARRAVYAAQQRLEFPFLCVGPPEPRVAPATRDGAGASLRGKPVSRGVAEGPVRVARTLAEAEAVQAGEILVTPVTDVGWTPYFRLLAGLVTEVGSTISHGAVVAREYGLPAVVNVREATHRLRTGQRVRLDGDAGEIIVLEDETC